MIDFTEDVRGYPVSDLRQVGVANDVVAEVEVAVVSDPADPQRWAVYSRRLHDIVLEFEMTDGALRDTRTGSTFDAVSGRGLTGDVQGRVLDRLPALTSFPGGGPTKAPVFDTFWPEGTIWRPAGAD